MAETTTEKAMLEAQIANLKIGRASDTLRIKDGDTERVFRSVAEIDKAIKLAERDLANLENSTQRPPRAFVVRTSKGL